MPRVLWSVASLFLVASAVQAAQGVHPGPLPAPLGPAPGGTPAPGDGGYATTESYGPGYGTAVGPREGADYGYGWGGRPGYPAPPPASRYGYGGGSGDPGYGRPPQGADSSPRGYWQWVPAEPGGGEPYGQESGMPPYSGFGDAYPPYGRESPTHEGPPGQPYPGGFAPPSYEGYGEPHPGRRGAPPGYSPGAYAPSSGASAEPPLGGWSAGPGSQAPAQPEAASRASGGPPERPSPPVSRR